jgi:YVTN family beta-propeller protein
MKGNRLRTIHRPLLLLIIVCGVMTVGAYAQAPVAANDRYVVWNPNKRVGASQGVLVNDLLPSGSTGSAALVTPPSHGKVTLKSNGEFTFYPAAGYYGTDSFTYKVVANGLSSNVATVSLDVEYRVQTTIQVPIVATVPNPLTREYVQLNGTTRYIGRTTWNHKGLGVFWYYTQHALYAGTAVGLTSGTAYTVDVWSETHDQEVPPPPFDWNRIRPFFVRHPTSGTTMQLMFSHTVRVNADGTTTAPPILDGSIFIRRGSSTPLWAYVTSPATDSVSVVNTSTRKTVAKVAVGDAPEGVAVSPMSDYVYVANTGSDTVSVIRVATNTVVATVPVGDAPRRVVIDRLGTRAYVVNSGSNSVSVIDTATNAVVDTVDAADGYTGRAPAGLGINHVGTRLYVANEATHDVSVIDTATGSQVGLVALGARPGELAVKPDGSRVCVGLPDAGGVAIIEAATNLLSATVPVGQGPAGMAFATPGDWLYVANSGSDSVSVLDVATGSVLKTITQGVGSAPTGVDAVNTGNDAFVTNAGSATMSQIRVSTVHVVSISNSVAATTTLSPAPSQVALLY